MVVTKHFDDAPTQFPFPSHVTICAVASTIEFAPHDGELVFGFVLGGSAHLEFGDGGDLAAGDAFVIPPKQAWSLTAATPDLRLLHVTTSIH